MRGAEPLAKSGKTKYSASESLQGYLYQCRHALLLLLRRNRAVPSVRMSVEKFDDVAFDGGGQPLELIQTKHRTQPGNLTDLSEDLWKTLRIWTEGVRDNEFLLPGTLFSLITTQIAPDGGAAALLRPGENRNPAKAMGLLVAAAKATTNAKLKDACEVFLKLSAKKLNAMLSEVYVYDNAARIADLDKQLRQEIYYAAPLDRRESFQVQLEGWWFRRVIRHLTTPNQPPIRGIELEREMERLKDGYTDDNLPIEIPLPEPPTPPDPANDPREFVARLRRIGVPPPVSAVPSSTSTGPTSTVTAGRRTPYSGSTNWSSTTSGSWASGNGFATTCSPSCLQRTTPRRPGSDGICTSGSTTTPPARWCSSSGRAVPSRALAGGRSTSWPTRARSRGTRRTPVQHAHRLAHRRRGVDREELGRTTHRIGLPLQPGVLRLGASGSG